MTYQNQGSASISFFASGANYDGAVWYNGVIGTCRPGFILSVEKLEIPYAGSATFTLKPDTVPTADTIVTVVSSQPTKVTALTEQLLFSAGRIQEIPVILHSQCSRDPGNCARSGSTKITFVAISMGGNYDGVNSSNYILAVVSAPKLVLSRTALLVQESSGLETFSIVPAVPPNLDTSFSLSVLDPAICNVTSQIVLTTASNSSSANPVEAVVSFISVGQTYVRITPSGPADSIFADIDPVYVYVRCMGSFNLSSRKLILQKMKDISVSVQPNLEISSDVHISLQVSNSLVLSVEPRELIFSPPRMLIGMSVPPRVGMQVVRSESYQVWPRLGVGVIAKILNDNLDLVAVNWTSGIKLEPNPVGSEGKFYLALYSNDVGKFTISWVSNGHSSVRLSAVSGDVNYNGVVDVDAVVVEAQPAVILTPQTLTIQMGGKATFTLRPSVAPSVDLDILITPSQVVSNTSQQQMDIVAIAPNVTRLLRVFEDREENWKVISISCLQPGSTQVRFRGNAGNYYQTDCSLLPVTCLPGFRISKSQTAVLSSENAGDRISISLLSVPTASVTVLVTSSDQGLIIFTQRLIFEPLLSHQDATILVEHAGAFRSGVATLSIRAHGGNYEGAELLDAIQVPVKGPSLEISTHFISVQPGGTSMLYVRLDTVPSANVMINATCSDEGIAVIRGPDTPFIDTNFQSFNITFVSSGIAYATLYVFSTLGSTYGNFTPQSGTNLTIQIQSKGPGFQFAETEIFLSARSRRFLFFGPDTSADSTVTAQVDSLFRIYLCSLF
jgi:hypothetical protein